MSGKTQENLCNCEDPDCEANVALQGYMDAYRVPASAVKQGHAVVATLMEAGEIPPQAVAVIMTVYLRGHRDGMDWCQQ